MYRQSSLPLDLSRNVEKHMKLIMNIIYGDYNQNPMTFYGFVSSKRHENSRVLSLNSGGITHSDR